MNQNRSISTDHRTGGRARLGGAVLAVGIAASALVVSGISTPANGAAAVPHHDEGTTSVSETYTVTVPCFIGRAGDRWPADAGSLPTCTRTYLK
jgi:hypothetical protein